MVGVALHLIRQIAIPSEPHERLEDRQIPYPYAMHSEKNASRPKDEESLVLTLCAEDDPARWFAGSTRSSAVQLPSQPKATLGRPRQLMATAPRETQQREQAPTSICG